MAKRHLLSSAARGSFFDIPSDMASLERYYVLATDDLDLIGSRRGAENQQLRQKCQAGLNKGEARHTLAKAVFAHSQGRINDRSPDAQQKRAMALNLVIAAIIYWNTMNMNKAADHLRRAGKLPDPSLLKHVSPLGWTHINLTGDYVWDSGAAECSNERTLHLRLREKMGLRMKNQPSSLNVPP